MVWLSLPNKGDSQQPPRDFSLAGSLSKLSDDLRAAHADDAQLTLSERTPLLHTGAKKRVLILELPPLPTYQPRANAGHRRGCWHTIESFAARFSGWQRSEFLTYTSTQLERLSGLELGRLFAYLAWSLLFMLPYWIILGLLIYLLQYV
jgi:hypothetical protein